MFLIHKLTCAFYRNSTRFLDILLDTMPPLHNRRFNFKISLIIFLVVVLGLRIRYLSLLPSAPKGPIVPVNSISDEPSRQTSTISIHGSLKRVTKSLNDTDVKFFILNWTPGLSPFEYFRNGGQEVFISNNCEYTNCFVTYNRNYLKNITSFDAILFSIFGLKNLKIKFPSPRSPKQKYIAVSKEPAELYPLTHPYLEGFFNWTWTYRLKSDVIWRNFRFYAENGTEIGPNENVSWLKEYKPVSEEVQDILIQKSKLVAWIVTDCNEKKRLDNYIYNLNTTLLRHGFQIDVYGKSCGENCGNQTECHSLLEKEYCFYLALDTYFDEDYISDVLVTAFDNYAIPVVFAGDVIYQRYLPPGSYLDASKISVWALAKKMKTIMENFTLHQEYFKWRNHYVYELMPCGAQFCSLCEALNTKSTVTTIYNQFRTWWNGKPVLNVRDMVMSIFLSEPQMVRLLVRKNYTALTRLFEEKYVPEGRNNMLSPIIILEPLPFNFSTTDPNTGYDFLSDTTEYTALVDDD